MRLVFVHSHRFIKAKESYYTTGQFPFELFETRYLNNFQNVIVCARVEKKSTRGNLDYSEGKNVEFKELPNLTVIKKRKSAFKKTEMILKEEIEKADIVVARMPSEHAQIAIKLAKKINKPLVVEVVGDIFESYWNHGSIYGKILAPLKAIQYKKSIKKSKYTIYVTKNQLQKKYPSAKNANTINASNVELEVASLSVLKNRIEREKVRSKSDIIKIGLIGSFSTKYKGIQNGIDLIASLQKENIYAELHILGNGDNKWLIKRAKKLGVLESIHFHGLLPTGTPVLEWLDKLDLYIQPSLTEGLPRALIEAMSRGLPAIGSNVGGIPELLEYNYLHKPNNSRDLFNKVLSIIKNKTEMINQSEKNFKKASEYSTEVLRKRREVFWADVIKKELK